MGLESPFEGRLIRLRARERLTLRSLEVKDA